MDNHPLANIERLHAHMDADDLDALILHSGVNVTYLWGDALTGTLARHIDLVGSSRGFVLVWPRHGEPAFILDVIAKGRAERNATVKNIRAFDGYVETPYDELCRTLRDMGLEEARAGIETGYTSHRDWEHLRATLPRLQLFECGPLMDSVRLIKTDAELALFRRAADLLDDVLLQELSRVQVGETEREVHARIVAGLIREGAGWAHGILNSSRNSVIYCGEGDTRFQSGDVVRNDYVSYLAGYPGHQSRTAILGTPSAEQLRDYGIYLDVYRRTIDHVRPGMQTGAVYAFCDEAFRAAGWTYKPAHIGHSIGPWMHQQDPWIKRGGDALIEEGMVIAIEPFIDHWHLQDLFLVGAQGLELLSPKFSTDKPLII
jgi:Xaa-Pro aminopeptidase